MSRWKRTYWSVWASNLITAMGMMSFLPFFPSHLERLGLTDPAEIQAWSGAIFGAAPLAAAFMMPIWGALGDRFGRRLMAVRAMLAISLFVGAMSFAASPLQLFLLRLGQGLFSGFVAPSATLVSINAPPEKQGQVVGSLQSAMAIGAVIGPFVGGMVGPLYGGNVLFLGVSVAAAISAALVLFFAHEDKASRQQAQTEFGFASILDGAKRDIGKVFANREVRGAVLLLFCMQFGLGATNPLLELFVRDLSDLDADSASRMTGMLFSTMAAINIVALPLWGRYGDRKGHRHALVRCTLWTSAALCLHAVAPALWFVFMARALLGAGLAGATPCAFGIAACEIPIEKRGGAFGVVVGARTLAMAISSMMGGYLARYIGIRGLFIAGGVVVLLALLALRWRTARNGAAELEAPAD